ncbi:Gfo/Idh/MocA family protein [Gracilimonas amylolytica]|uniref:Gfo/Idh/MocA family protein n=1 Tax=Gracilimonas amylolytica TaxID=1749045 RepID=UPI000CD9C37B|nr:Gfo/Idh/MocA family oxidoreductase [Gracilimonas amylolytica]
MNILIIGLGSIAKKHLNVLKNLDSDLSAFALRSNKSENNEEGIQSIYSWTEIPKDIDFIIISNPSSMHAETILKSLDFEVPLFVEKPVLHSLNRSGEIIKKVRNKGVITYVACNLRFHPAIQFLKREFSKNVPIEYNSYCGSYLPEWRPNTDYREIYSAKKELGGGVHLDLIHEIDYCNYLLGTPIESFSYCRRKSTLEINSVDVAHYVFEYEKSSAFITLNYYRKDSKRDIECVWEDKTWHIDLLRNLIVNGESEVIYSEPFDIMDTYTSQMRSFIEYIEREEMPENNIEQGIETLKLALNG